MNTKKGLFQFLIGISVYLNKLDLSNLITGFDQFQFLIGISVYLNNY